MSKKLHEILAVEDDLEKSTNAVTNEASVIFTKKQEQHFEGFMKAYESFEENAFEEPSEVKEVVTSVGKKLQYVLKYWKKFLHVSIQKEATNQLAKADIIIDDIVLAKDVPATGLLSLEKRLSHIKKMFLDIPTLEPGKKWIVSNRTTNEIGTIYEVENKETKFRTKNVQQHSVVVQATEHFPAQVVTSNQDTIIGKYEKTIWSGKILPADKSKYLEKIDTLIAAVKQARQRANQQEVVEINYIDKLIDFITE